MDTFILQLSNDCSMVSLYYAMTECVYSKKKYAMSYKTRGQRKRYGKDIDYNVTCTKHILLLTRAVLLNCKHLNAIPVCVSLLPDIMDICGTVRVCLMAIHCTM